MANPFTKRPAIQDQIIEAPDLQPQVRVVGSPYAAPTVRVPAEVPKENQLQMLAEGLSTINPAIQNAVGMVAKKYSAGEIAQADADSLKTNAEYAAAVKSGAIKPGSSRFYVDRYLTNDLKKHGEAFGPALTAAWAESGVMQLDALPGSYEKFAGDFAKDWNRDHLRNEYGGPKYSPLQIKESGYSETQNAAIAHLNAHNTSVIVDERTKKGEDTVASGTQALIKAALVGTDGLPVEAHARTFTGAAKSITALAKSMTDAGMLTSRATAMLTLGTMEAAREAKDASIIDQVGAAIDASRDPSAPISKTQDWLKARPVMREHIASVNQTDRVHAEEMMRVDALGTPAERQKYYADVAANQKGAVVEGTQTRLAHAAKDLVYDFPDQLHMTPDQLAQQKQHLADLRKIDPTEALSAETTLHSLRHPQELLGTAHSQSLVEMTLARMVDANPSSPQTAKSMDLALQHGDIDGAAWNRLHNDTEARRSGPLTKMLADPSVARMLTAIEHGGVAHIDSITGEESQAGGLSRMDGERAVMAHLQKHPQADNMEVVGMLSKVMPSIVDSHNSVRVAEIAQQKEQKRITDQILKAENQTRDLAKQDAQDELDRISIRKEYAPRYSNAKQLDGVVDQVFQHRRGKKK